LRKAEKLILIFCAAQIYKGKFSRFAGAANRPLQVKGVWAVQDEKHGKTCEGVRRWLAGAVRLGWHDPPPRETRGRTGTNACATAVPLLCRNCGRPPAGAGTGVVEFCFAKSGGFRHRTPIKAEGYFFWLEVR
jgi:hypothetical protein